METNHTIDMAEELICEYWAEWFGNHKSPDEIADASEAFEDESNIHVQATSVGENDEYMYQTRVNLSECAVAVDIDGKIMDLYEFDDLDDMWDNALCDLNLFGYPTVEKILDWQKGMPLIQFRDAQKIAEQLAAEAPDYDKIQEIGENFRNILRFAKDGLQRLDFFFREARVVRYVEQDGQLCNGHAAAVARKRGNLFCLNYPGYDDTGFLGSLYFKVQEGQFLAVPIDY